MAATNADWITRRGWARGVTVARTRWTDLLGPEPFSGVGPFQYGKRPRPRCTRNADSLGPRMRYAPRRCLLKLKTQMAD